MNNSILAVDLTSAPQHIQDEIESMKGKFNGLDDMDKVSDETRRWIIENFDPLALANKMKERIDDICDEMSVNIAGIEMLDHIMPKKNADALNLKLYNVCAEFVRAYNSRNM